MLKQILKMNKCLHCYLPVSENLDMHTACALAFYGAKQAPILAYTLQDMAGLAKDVVERSIAVPGVQPKLSLSVLADKIENNTISRLTVVGALGGGYILKPPSATYPQMPANESATMHLAQILGIATVPNSLIKLQSGELCYITKRIDRREDGYKIHLLDMYQITEAFDKYRSSYEKVGKAVLAYCSYTMLDVLRLWELCMFCYITANNDMHLKNFSLIKINSDWQLCPAYDLLNVQLANPDDKEELGLTLVGKKKKIKLVHFMEWGKSMGLTTRQMENSLQVYSDKKNEVTSTIASSFLTQDFKEKYLAIVDAQLNNFGL
jgi:serine/threonine-protein kinase HipA